MILDPGRPAVVGVDPGPVCGVALLDVTSLQVELAQVTPDLVVPLLRSWSFGQLLGVAVERFVVRARAARSATPGAGAIARDLVSAVVALEQELGCPVRVRSAGEVKPWATDRRLTTLNLPRGMPHAVDAVRHALFLAVRDFGAPDPFSRRSRSPR